MCLTSRAENRILAGLVTSRYPLPEEGLSMEPWMLLLGAACCCFPIAAGLVGVAVWFLIRGQFGGQTPNAAAHGQGPGPVVSDRAYTERTPTTDLGPTTEVPRTPEAWRSPPLPSSLDTASTDLHEHPDFDDEDDLATVVGPPPPGLLNPSRRPGAEPPRSPASAPPPPPRSSAIHERRPGQTIIAFDDDDDDDDESHEIG